MGGFSNPVVGGGGALIRNSAHSPDFAAGVDGWSVNQDGSAEFNNVTVRGSIDAGSISAGSIGDSTIVNSDFQGGTMENTNIVFDSNGGSLLVYSSTTTMATFTTSGSFTVPAGITSLKVECWGAGGGAAGGGLGGGANSGGYGGGGGAYAVLNNFAATPGNSYAYVVASGGSGGSPNNLGTNGGITSFNGTSCRAFGGTAATLSSTGKGGAASSSTGDTKFNGGNSASATGSGGSSGGGSAGPSANGNNGSGNTGTGSKAGGAAVSGGGAGGSSGSANNNGAAGGTPGGGGGGGGGGASAGNGGAGARGQVRVTYTSARTLVGSVSPVAGTDGYGNSYQAGVGGFVDPSNMAIGQVTITPSAVDTPTSITVNYGPLTGSTFYGFASANTTVPGYRTGATPSASGVTGVSMSSVTATSALVWVNRENLINTAVNWQVWGV